MWRHNICLITKKDKRKEQKYTRRNAYQRILGLLHINNKNKLDEKMKEPEALEQEEKKKEKFKKLRNKFLSDEYVVH